MLQTVKHIRVQLILSHIKSFSKAYFEMCWCSPNCACILMAVNVVACLAKEHCQPLNKKTIYIVYYFSGSFLIFFQNWWCCMFVVAMVKWSNMWLKKLNKNDVEIKLWAKRKDFEYVSMRGKAQ